jgi:phosphonoacetaldehyde hydrolase
VLTGNLMGLDEAGVAALSPADLAAARERISASLTQAGAHLVIGGIWDLPAALDEIQARVLRGERP